MYRIGIKHVTVCVLLACAAVSTMFLVPLDRGTYTAMFSYRIVSGGDKIPFLHGNKVLAERFCSRAFVPNVLEQCRAHADIREDENALVEIITNATISVLRGEDGVRCDFSLHANSRRTAEEVAKCYLAAMKKELDDNNHALVKKATSEISASLSMHEQLARTAQKKYDEAKIAGVDIEECRRNLEKLASECDLLRRQETEIEEQTFNRSDRLVIVRQLAVERE